jgi:hypothetical protein
MNLVRYGKGNGSNRQFLLYVLIAPLSRGRCDALKVLMAVVRQPLNDEMPSDVRRSPLWPVITNSPSLRHIQASDSPPLSLGVCQ